MAADPMAVDSPADGAPAFNALFHVPGSETLPADVLGELQSIARLNAIDPQEVFFKWESFAIKMGAADTQLDLAGIRAFKADILENLEREARERASAARSGAGKSGQTERKAPAIGSTPRPMAASGDDFLGMLEGATPKTPVSNGPFKRKAAAETRVSSKSVRSTRKTSPSEGRIAASEANSALVVPFNERANPGQIVETLNAHLSPAEPPLAPPAQSRATVRAATDLKKFSYKPLAMQQTEASEVLDDRIDDFMQIIQEGNGIDSSSFGNAASKSTNEVVAVGRIASDASEGKLNESSMLLELSRRQGAGLRVPLKFSSGIAHEFFPGQIVAVRGTNASGEYFAVSEVLEIPLLPPSAPLYSTFEESNARLGIDNASEASAAHALSLVVACGPYTADDNLDFEPLHALCDRAAEESVDILLLAGPFLDIEHPLIASGDFYLPENAPIDLDQATLADAFRHMIVEPLRRLVQAHPCISIVLVPSTRDAINKHTAWPQEPFTGMKRDLGLPKQVRSVTNPCALQFNEVIVGISAQDVLNDLRREEVLVGRPSEANLLARLPRHLIRQRHFYPLYPPIDRTGLPRPTGVADGDEETYAVGTPLDPTYLKLAEMLAVRPDVLITPSALLPFAKVVESVVAINPGPLSKRRGAGTYAKISIHPRTLSTEDQAHPERAMVSRVFDRARVDVIRI